MAADAGRPIDNGMESGMAAQPPPAAPAVKTMTPASMSAPVLTMLIWAGNTVVTKAASGVIEPASIAFYRWLIAFLVLLAIFGPAAWRQRTVMRRHWYKLAILGLLGMVIYQSLAYEAAKTTSAVNMGVLVALMPLVSTLLASAFAGERLTWPRIVGGLTSLAGLVYLTSHGTPSMLLSGGFHIGDGLMIVAIIANSLYGVLLKRWSLPLTMWLQLFWQVGFATLALLPIWLLSDISPITWASLPLVLYAALPTSLLAPFLWMTAIRDLGAGRSAMFINLLPVMIAALAWATLGEQLYAYHVVGGGLALIGVAIALRPARGIKAPADDVEIEQL